MSRSDSERIGIVVGIAAEARIARRLGWPVAIGGGTPEGARLAALRLADRGAGALVSFGLVGGLDPSLRPGDLVVAEAVLVGGTRMAVDPALARRLGGATGHVVLAGEQVIADCATKRRLWQETGCAAVDLESGAVAGAAAARGLRFAVLRAVCDPAERSLPPAALLALSGDGRIRPALVLLSLARQPGQVSALLALARDAAAARRVLAGRATAVRGAVVQAAAWRRPAT